VGVPAFLSRTGVPSNCFRFAPRVGLFDVRGPIRFFARPPFFWFPLSPLGGVVVFFLVGTFGRISRLLKDLRQPIASQCPVRSPVFPGRGPKRGPVYGYPAWQGSPLIRGFSVTQPHAKSAFIGCPPAFPPVLTPHPWDLGGAHRPGLLPTNLFFTVLVRVCPSTPPFWSNRDPC